MPSLEFFWGVEVKPGQTVSCDPGKGCILRLSQAALGETKKGSSIVVSAKIDDQKVIVGTLSAENRPQLRCDLIFHKEIELSHSSKTASVFLCGYRAVMPDQPESDSSKDEGEAKTEVKTVNQQVIVDDSDSSSLDDFSSSDDDSTEDESSSEDDSSEGDDNSSEEDDSRSEEDDSSSEEDSSDEEDKNTPMKVWDTPMKLWDDNSTEEDDSSSEEIDTTSEEIDSSSKEDSSDEEDKNTPKKPEVGKKRVAETALKTPASDKKAKIATSSSETTGDKKVLHVATPHPAKQASKAPGNSNNKPKVKSPKSGGTHACKSCSRTFGSDTALQSHEKAKHV